jgi:phage RecT family recombinase
MGELVRQLVDKNREDIVKRLRGYLPPEQFFTLAYNLDRNAALAAVAQKNPESLLKAIFQAADAGLLIGSAYNHCALAKFGDEVQLMVQYQGIIYQLVRAGAILTMGAACVYDGDHIVVGLHGIETFERNLRDDRRRNWRWLNDKANMLGAFASAQLPVQARPGEFVTQDHFSPIGEIEHAREISKNGSNPNGPWAQHYDAMAMKTAVRRCSKFITVCGATDENKEAWERFGRTMELERSEYKEHVEPKMDDSPGKSGKSGPKSARAVEEPASRQGATPSPRNGESRRTKAPVAPTSTAPKPVEKPAPPPTDELIGLDAQQDLMEKANNAGLDPDSFYDHIHEKYGVPGLKHLKQSQAAEIEQYLRQVENDR